MKVGGLSAALQKHLRASGHSQKQLADKIGLHPKVLSRKIHNSQKAYLSHQEIRQIITILIGWGTITTQDEVHALLELAQVEPTLFSANDWKTQPLSILTTQRSFPHPLNFTTPLQIKLQHNIPSPKTRLIGRTWAVTRLHALLKRDDVRLITLIGSGGSGKTRLALHVAHELITTFTHGAWLIDLSGVNDANLVPMHITQVLRLKTIQGLSPLQSLIAYLHDKQLLLLLDNFEQVEAATSAIAEMLDAAPDLKVLITSRSVLHLYGEHELSIPPLDFPDPNLHLTTTEIACFDAIQLFVERAQAVKTDFTLTDANAATIVRICAQIDGLPLALELAAARIKVLSPALLLEQLASARLPVLTGGARNLPGRQQTMRNTIVWSYDLLSLAQQAWFRRLGIFAGNWSFEAMSALIEGIPVAETVQIVSPSALDLLAHLLDNSLCVQMPMIVQEVRFAMLETLREYALEQISTQGELELLRDWHACYYLREVEAAEIGLRGPEQVTWLTRLIADRKNVQAALQWSLQRAREEKSINTAFFCAHIPITARTEIAGSQILSTQGLHNPQAELPAIELCLRLASAFRPYWEWQGYLEEGRNWLKSALSIPLADKATRPTLAAHAKAQSEAARLICLQNDQIRASELAEASSSLYQELADPVGLGFAQLHRGWAAHSQGDYEMARSAYRKGMASLDAQTQPWLYAQLLLHLAAATGFTSRFDEMRSYYAESQKLFELIGDKSSCADLLKDQGGMLILEGCYREAIDYLVPSLRLCYELRHRQFIATGLGWLSFAVALLALPDQVTASLYAAQLKGASDNLMDEIGLNPWSRTSELILALLEHIQSYVDAQSWEDALAQGRALTLEQVFELIAHIIQAQISL